MAAMTCAPPITAAASEKCSHMSNCTDAASIRQTSNIRRGRASAMNSVFQ